MVVAVAAASFVLRNEANLLDEKRRIKHSTAAAEARGHRFLRRRERKLKIVFLY